MTFFLPLAIRLKQWSPRNCSFSRNLRRKYLEAWCQPSGQDQVRDQEGALPKWLSYVRIRSLGKGGRSAGPGLERFRAGENCGEEPQELRETCLGFPQDGLVVSESLCSSLGVIFVSLHNVATLNSHYFSNFHYLFN